MQQRAGGNAAALANESSSTFLLDFIRSRLYLSFIPSFQHVKRRTSELALGLYVNSWSKLFSIISNLKLLD